MLNSNELNFWWEGKESSNILKSKEANYILRAFVLVWKYLDKSKYLKML